MTMQNLTRQRVDAAEPLTFPTKRAAVVHVAYRGVPVDVTIEDASAVSVEKLVDSLLSRDGWAAPAPTPAERGNTPAARPRRPALPEPHYADDGSPCCPWHRKPLKEGRYGLFCPSRAEGEQANEKGYCTFTVKA
jgi:hypothetical protein